MTEEGPALGNQLDALGLVLVMLDPEDLVALGDLLEKIERVAETLESLAREDVTQIISGMRRTVEAIILEQVADKNLALELIGHGVGLLQDIDRNLNAGISQAVDLTSFHTELAAVSEAGSRGGATPVPTRAPVTPETGLAPEPTPSDSSPPDSSPGSQPPSTSYDASQDKDLFFSFINESMEHIETIEVAVVGLEHDPSDLETINTVFRPFHTIKGVSGFLNLHEIHGLTHDVENLLDDARNDRIKISESVIDLVLDAVDLLKAMIRDLRIATETGVPTDKDYQLPAFTERIRAIQQGEMPTTPTSAISPYGGQRIGEILVDQGLISQGDLAKLVQTQQEGRLRRLGQIVVDRGLLAPAELEEALARQLDDRTKKLGEILVETGKVDATEISHLIQEQEHLRETRLGEILIRENRAGAREVATALREQRKAPEAGPAHTVKVETAKLDGLVDLVGELVIAQSLVAANEKILSLKDQKIIRDMSHMSRITSELQRTAMSMRMVQIRQTFQKMIRLVRDLSRKSGKLVELEMEGEETEIDRNMVEAIYDPLVHMIRNSVDHGMELSAVREKKGKPAEGRILLRAFHQGGNVVIEIEDDGQGLDRKRILAKAVERGLINADDNLSDPAAFALIFQPGFSTAEKVTDVSGRGVGMDVVKKTIEKLRGKVEVKSRLGHGTTITIRLPLTLAIIDGMIVRVGENRYILPTVAIRESFRPTRGEYHTVKGRGEMIRVRDSLLPLVRLDSVLGAAGAEQDPTSALVVVVENEAQRRCLMVDEVLGKQEVVIKSLGERLKYVKCLAGGSILGDGRVGLILDVAGLIEVSDGYGGVGPVGGGAAKGAEDWEMDTDWGMGAG